MVVVRVRRESYWTMKLPPPMPELCGSTTLSASIVAIAASVALPPLRRISTPAAAARGSAALTTPCASAAEGSNRARSNTTSFFIGAAVAGFGVAAKPLRQPVQDRADEAGALIDQR